MKHNVGGMIMREARGSASELESIFVWLRDTCDLVTIAQGISDSEYITPLARIKARREICRSLAERRLRKVRQATLRN